MIEFVRKIANEKVKVREGDDMKEITRMEALVRILYQMAMKGDQKAMTAYLRLMRDAGLASDPSDEPQCGLIAVPLRSETAAEWERRHRDIRAPLDYWNEQNAANKVPEKGTDSPDDNED